MSDIFALQRAIWSSELDALDRLVVLAIVSYWSVDSPEPYPSFKALTQRTGLSRATLARRIQSLAMSGAIRVSTRVPRNGGQPTNHYDLTSLTARLVSRVNQSQSETSTSLRVRPMMSQGEAKDVSEQDQSHCETSLTLNTNQSQSETSTSLRVRPEVSIDLSREESISPLPPVGGNSDQDSEAKPKRGRKGKPPADFEPTDAHRSIARERSVDFDLELAKFRDHEFQRAIVDHDAAFRNWLRSASPARARANSVPRVGEAGYRRQPDAGAINLSDYAYRPKAVPNG